MVHLVLFVIKVSCFTLYRPSMDRSILKVQRWGICCSGVSMSGWKMAKLIHIIFLSFYLFYLFYSFYSFYPYIFIYCISVYTHLYTPYILVVAH